MSQRNDPSPDRPASDEWVLAVRQRLTAWGPDHWQDFPWRRDIPFWQALVAEFFLLRTRASQVVPVFERFRSTYRSAESLGAATPGELEELIRPLGLRWRAPLFVALVRAIHERRGRLPRDLKKLRMLPGIGDYGAAAAASLHGGHRAVIIDANVVRVLCRLTGEPFDGETRRRKWLRDLAERLTPLGDSRAFNYALLDHSMTVCVPRLPRCSDCPLQTLCASASHTVACRPTLQA